MSLSFTDQILLLLLHLLFQLFDSLILCFDGVIKDIFHSPEVLHLLFQVDQFLSGGLSSHIVSKLVWAEVLLSLLFVLIVEIRHSFKESGQTSLITFASRKRLRVREQDIEDLHAGVT